MQLASVRKICYYEPRAEKAKEAIFVFTQLTNTLTTLITHVYATTGLAGIVLAMAIESACFTPGSFGRGDWEPDRFSDGLCHRLPRWATFNAEIWTLSAHFSA